MQIRRALVAAAAAALLIAACDDDDAVPTATPTLTATAVSTAAPTETPSPTQSATSTPDPTLEAPPAGVPLGRQVGGGTCEALFPSGLTVGQAVDNVFVCIDEPAPNEALAGAVTVRGYAAGAFENSIVVELRHADGRVLRFRAVPVGAPDIGLVVGDWRVDFAFASGELTRLFIAAYAESARDGSIDFGAAIGVVRPAPRR